MVAYVLVFGALCVPLLILELNPLMLLVVFLLFLFSALYLPKRRQP